MCLKVTAGSLQTAENDIVCYKIVIDKKDCWKSAFGVSQNMFPYDVELEEKGLPEETIRQETYYDDYDDKDRLAVGRNYFHAFLRHIDARRNTYMFGNLRQYANMDVCECIVPKDSQYYMGIDGLRLATTKIVVKSPNRDVGRMRVFAKRGSWKVAKEDLGMYTVVHLKISDLLNVPYYGRNYTTNGIWVADSQLCNCGEPEHLAVKMPNDMLMLGYGFFYSAPNLEMCDEYRKRHGMYNNPYSYTSEKTIACTIPKDTLYYIGDNGWVASRKIMFWRSMMVHDASQKTLNQE